MTAPPDIANYRDQTTEPEPRPLRAHQGRPLTTNNWKPSINNRGRCFHRAASVPSTDGDQRVPHAEVCGSHYRGREWPRGRHDPREAQRRRLVPGGREEVAQRHAKKVRRFHGDQGPPQGEIGLAEASSTPYPPCPNLLQKGNLNNFQNAAIDRRLMTNLVSTSTAPPRAQRDSMKTIALAPILAVPSLPTTTLKASR